MKPDKMQQAEALYMKTDLSKSEIAEMVGCSRRTVHHWTATNNWDRLKKSAQHMPALGVENLWIILTKVQESILSPARAFNPPTPDEIRMINHLGINIRRLTKRTPLNETIELRNHFMDFVTTQKPALALQVQDLIDGFIKARAAVQPGDFMGPKLDEYGCIPHKPNNVTEDQLDLHDRMEWAEDPFTPDDETGHNDDPHENPENPPSQPHTPAGFSEEDKLENFGASWVKPITDPAVEYNTHIAAQQEKEEQFAATMAHWDDEEDGCLENELQALQSERCYAPAVTEAAPAPIPALNHTGVVTVTRSAFTPKPKEKSYWDTFNEKKHKNNNRKQRRELERLQIKLAKKQAA